MADADASVAGCKIRHLTVVAGPKAVGKSRFIRRLAKDEMLRKRFGVPEFTRALSASFLAREPLSGVIEHVVLHYDIVRRLNRNETTYEHDPATLLLGYAERITFLTLRTTRERLRAQLERKADSRHTPHKRLNQLRSRYVDEQFLVESYERWLTFVELYGDVTVGNYFVEVHEDYTRSPVEGGFRSTGTLSDARDRRV